MWLAKSTLNAADSKEVLRRWAEHLSSPKVNQKVLLRHPCRSMFWKLLLNLVICRQSLAVLVMLSLGSFDKVVEMLYSMRHFARAALFIEACQEFQVMSHTTENREFLTSLQIMWKN